MAIRNLGRAQSVGGLQRFENGWIAQKAQIEWTMNTGIEITDRRLQLT
jgi:hypothetical protein